MAAATDDAGPIIFQRMRTTMKTTAAPTAGRVRAGMTPMRAPSPVATPLPPLNLRKGVNMWPIGAANMTASQVHASDGAISMWPRVPRIDPAMRVGVRPLVKSRMKQRAKYFLPRRRPRLEAPMFPEPWARMSMPLAFPMRYPKGMEPRRKEPAMRSGMRR